MDERVEFSQEMILNAIMSKVNEHADLLSLLVQSQEFMEEDVALIKKGVETIDKKIDLVLEKLNHLEVEFSALKNESREIEQKLLLLSSKLDKIEKEVSDEELEDYYALCQSLYDNWDELDELTRRLLPVAEYLFSQLQRYDKPDYSPVILELCRAIENEFLLKIFSKYTLDLIRREGRNLDTFLVTDRASSNLKKKTGEFVRVIAKSARTNQPEYTMGQMNTILSIMKEPETVRESPLLQDFMSYLNNETVVSDLLNTQYVKKINNLVEKYRNPSAHPRHMDIEKAKKCKEIMPDRIDYLMNCVCMAN